MIRHGLYTDDEPTSILCPVCGSDYNHIRCAYTRLGSDPVEAGVYDGTQARGKTMERRSALVVVFDGECNHSWEWEIQQHKGNNWLTVSQVPSIDRFFPRQLEEGVIR